MRREFIKNISLPVSVAALILVVKSLQLAAQTVKGNRRRCIKHRVLILLFLIISQFAVAQKKQTAILVFSKHTKYYHESIPAGIKAIQKLGKDHGFKVDTTTDATKFNDDNLKKYSALVFLSNSGDLLDTTQKISFIRYIEAGGGYLGIHGASTAEKSWPWYGKLVGAVFSDHPEPQIGTIIIQDRANPLTSFLPLKWVRKDEWYNFKQLPVNVNVLFTIDESSYTGGKHGNYHPVAWYHEFDGGRSFYTAIGHFDEAYQDPYFLRHILEGIRYAIGKNITLNYSKVKTPPYEQ